MMGSQGGGSQSSPGGGKVRACLLGLLFARLTRLWLSTALRHVCPATCHDPPAP